ncbi:hypothetical protein ACW7BJ_04400 [Azospirillum argentinense]|uniref:Uncharacterized protein n=1 Tax=Azospirillum argentinense TaxID=2970906 RepID=A0ABW8VBV9_9PROT|nr:hypothetical protein [Azospirillum argentinense]
MIGANGPFPITQPSPSLVERGQAAGRTAAPDGGFAGLLSDAEAPPSPRPTSLPGAAAPTRPDTEETARLRKERADYQAARDAEVRSRPQDPYPAIQIALPVNEAGYQPFVTADQQKLIDRITDGYIGKPAAEFLKMWDELHANGVSPEQLVQTATHFINDRGDIVPRDEATRSAARSTVASTLWTLSEA